MHQIRSVGLSAEHQTFNLGRQVQLLYAAPKLLGDIMTKSVVVELTVVEDGYDCDLCGHNYAAGWRVHCTQHPELNLELEPVAHCYDSTDYEDVECVFRYWINKGIVIPGAPVLTEEQLREFEFMQFLMPDVYEFSTDFFVDDKGNKVDYPVVTCLLTPTAIIGEYLSRVLDAPIVLLVETEDNNVYDHEYEDD